MIFLCSIYEESDVAKIQLKGLHGFHFEERPSEKNYSWTT